MTACCGTSTPVHVGCAIKFSKCVDSCYEFDAKIYVMKSAIKPFCTLCKQKCFYCGENHVMNNKDLSIIVCNECKKSWRHHINTSCKKKYDKNISKPPACVHTLQCSKQIQRQHVYPMQSRAVSGLVGSRSELRFVRSRVRLPEKSKI